MVVEPVMCAEDDEHGTLASKLEKLVSLVGELVRKSIIDVQLIDEQIEVICLGKSDVYESLWKLILGRR